MSLTLRWVVTKITDTFPLTGAERLVGSTDREVSLCSRATWPVTDVTIESGRYGKEGKMSVCVRLDRLGGASVVS